MSSTKYEEMKKEFRRLSIGKASVTDRIDHLRKMIKTARSERCAAPSEIQTMEKDLHDYELAWIMNVCSSISKGEKQNVSTEERKRRYKIANKFSNNIKENPEYIQAFHSIQRAYRRFLCIVYITGTLVFLLAVGGISSGLLWLWGHGDLESIRTQRAAVCQLPLSERAVEIRGIIPSLAEKENGCFFTSQKTEYQDIRKLYLDDLEQVRRQLLENVTQAVGDLPRFESELRVYLGAFPDEKLNKILESEVLPRFADYETVLTFNRYWEVSRNVEFSNQFILPPIIKSPTFIPEWKQISQYETFEEQIALKKERELVAWLMEFFAKHDPKFVQEWAYCRKDWSRCYYSLKEPVWAKEKEKYSLEVPLEDGNSKKILFSERPEYAPYITTAHRCWYMLKQCHGKNHTICEMEKFWLLFLLRIAEDEKLDPLYKSYYLAHVIQRLKLEMPIFYEFHLQKVWEGESSVQTDENLLSRFKEMKLILPPEEMKDRLITADGMDNSRRLKAHELNKMLLDSLRNSQNRSFCQNVSCYYWGGWIFNGEIHLSPALLNTEAGSLFVLLEDKQMKRIYFEQIAEKKRSEVMKSRDLSGIELQPVWLKKGGKVGGL